MTNIQQAAVEKLSRLKVGALFMEMGTGKTKVALDLIASKAHKVDYILWICPCSLKGEIEAERKKWHPELTLDVVGCESIGSSDRIYLEVLKKAEESKTFIVVDESLKIKNRHAKRTQRIIKLGENAEYKLILNGTPISKSYCDLWAQMEFLSPKILKIARIYRMGQGSEVDYYDLVCDGVGLETLMFNCLERKGNMLDVVKQEIQKCKGTKEFVKCL